jgi:pimeloyl-ACP methyl ester carboxylesterase
MKVRFSDFAGVPTRLFRGGAGRPVLLLHGVGMTADSWCRILPELARDFDAVAPDLLDNGFTGSGTYAGGPPHDAMLNHLDALIEDLGLHDITLIGSSFGAALSVLLYLRRPESFRSIVLLSSGSVFKSAEALVEMYQRSYANGRSALAEPTLEVCKARLSNLFHDPARIPHEILLMQLTPYALPHALTAFERRLTGMMDVEAMRPFAVGSQLAAVVVPMLAIWGKQDVRGDYEKAVAAFEQLPHVQFEALDRCGHLPHLEQSERVIELVRGFLLKAE